MVSSEDNLVNGIVIFKLDKSKAPLLASVFLSDNVHVDDGAKLLEVLPQIIFLDLFLEASKKDLLDCGL